MAIIDVAAARYTNACITAAAGAAAHTAPELPVAAQPEATSAAAHQRQQGQLQAWLKVQKW